MNATELPIVVGVAGDSTRHSRAALDWAASEARLHPRPIHLVHGAHPASGWSGSRWREPQPESLQSYLHHGRRLLNDARRYLTRSTEFDIEITTINSPDTGVDALLAVSETASAVVLQRNHHSLWQQLAASSVIEAVTAQAGCPVMIVPGEPGQGEDTDRSEFPVIVGIGPNGASAHAVSTAAQEAHWRGVDLRVLRVWQVPYDLPTYVRADDAEVALHHDRAVHELELAVAGVAGVFPGLRVDTHALRGDTVQVLLEATSEAQLMVLSRHMSSTLTWRALGHTTRQLVRHSAGPVCVTSPVVTADERDRAVATSLWPTSPPVPA